MIKEYDELQLDDTEENTSEFNFYDIFSNHFNELNEIFSSEQIKKILMLEHTLFFSDDYINVFLLKDYPYHITELKSPYSTQKMQEKYKENKEVFRIILQAQMYLNSSGTFFISNFAIINKLITEIYNQDKKVALDLNNTLSTFLIENNIPKNKNDFNSFYNTFFDFKKHLIDNKYEYFNMNLDFNTILNIKDENELIKKLESYENINKKDFPQYNDLDLFPFMMENDYCLMDFSSNNFYIIKYEDNIIKIFMVDRSYKDFVPDNNEYIDIINEFIFNNKQEFLFLKDSITEINLIAEFNENEFLTLNPAFDHFVVVHASVLNYVYEKY